MSPEENNTVGASSSWPTGLHGRRARSRDEQMATGHQHVGFDGRGQAVVAALRTLARRSVASVVGAYGAGVTLTLTDVPFSVGSNEFAEQVDEVQYGRGEGPGPSAIETGEVMRSRSIGGEETRWPAFSTHAAQLGLRSVVSSPLLLHGVVVGALDLYGRARDSFTEDDSATVEATSRAERSLSGLALSAGLADLAVVLADAVLDRADVDIAVGVLMGRYQMGPGAARILLRQVADLDQVTMVAAAHSVVAAHHTR